MGLRIYDFLQGNYRDNGLCGPRLQVVEIVFVEYEPEGLIAFLHSLL